MDEDKRKKDRHRTRTELGCISLLTGPRYAEATRQAVAGNDTICQLSDALRHLWMTTVVIPEGWSFGQAADALKALDRVRWDVVARAVSGKATGGPGQARGPEPSLLARRQVNRLTATRKRS